MVDKVKPLKFETESEVDYLPTETNPNEDYLSSKGIALSGSDTTIIYEQNGEILFQDGIKNTPKELSRLLNFAEITIPDGRRVSTTSFTVKSRFRFMGTNFYKAPVQMAVIANADGTAIGEVKIYNLTNATQIALKSGISNTTPQIVDLGALTNLPTNEAIFEIQYRRVSGLGGLSVWGLSIKW